MNFKKYRITVNLNSTKLNYQIVKRALFNSTNIYWQSQINLSEEIVLSPELIMSTLLNTISQDVNDYIASKSWFVINLDPNHIQHKTLALPKIALSQQEFDYYVENSLQKLFDNHVNEIVFDYQTRKTDSNSINVAICQQSDITQWLNTISELKLAVLSIGMAQNKHHRQINFLPWRQRQLKKRVTQSIIAVMLYLFTSVTILFIHHQHIQTNIVNYENRLKNLTHQYQKLMTRSSIINSDIMANRTQLFQLLLMLSQKITSPILLETLNYQPKQMTISGIASTYQSVVDLANLLNLEITITSAQIESINSHPEGLFFDIGLNFDEQ